MTFEIKQNLEKNYQQTLKSLLEYEIENGAKLIVGYTIDSAIEEFMDRYYTTLFDLRDFLE